MAYLTKGQIESMGFKSIGKNVKISDRASIYNAELIEIGDRTRIDDFCLMSGSIKVGMNVHITPFCLVAGGYNGVIIEDFVTLAYGVKIFSQSDDYSGKTMSNSTVPKKYKNETKECTVIKRHAIIGAGSTVMPGVILAEGSSIGAMSLVRKSTEPWSIYVGSPARRIKSRSKELLELEKEYLREANL